MNKGIEWALKTAREELEQTGKAFRRPDLKAAWGDRQDARVKSYEESCNELRSVIADLEVASRVVIVPLGGLK